MSKTLENQELQDETGEKFPNLEYIILDVSKRLNREKITPKSPDYDNLVETAIRLTLLKPKYGILKPGQPSNEKQEWFEQVKLALEEQNKATRARDWKITSARRQQLREERRAGQTYKESDLE